VKGEADLQHSRLSLARLLAAGHFFCCTSSEARWTRQRFFAAKEKASSFVLHA